MKESFCLDGSDTMLFALGEEELSGGVNNMTLLSGLVSSLLGGWGNLIGLLCVVGLIWEQW